MHGHTNSDYAYHVKSSYLIILLYAKDCITNFGQHNGTYIILSDSVSALRNAEKFDQQMAFKDRATKKREEVAKGPKVQRAKLAREDARIAKNEYKAALIEAAS